MKADLIAAYAPMQTKGTPKLVKALPVIVAQMLARIQEYSTGQKLIISDAWNTFGLPMDKEYNEAKEREPDLTREEFNSNKIEGFKEYFRDELGLQTAEIEYSDSTPQTLQIVQELLTNLLNSETIKAEQYLSMYCELCQDFIAPKESGAESCIRCGSKLVERKSEGLFLTVDPSLISRNLEIYPSKLQSRFAVAIKQIPRRILLNKNREAGLDLSFIGFGGVLDPKVGIALMPYVLQEMTGQEVQFVVHGHDEVLLYKYDALMLAISPYLPNSVFAHSLLKADIAAVSGNIDTKLFDEGSWHEFLVNIIPILLLDREIHQNSLIQEYMKYKKYLNKLKNTNRFYLEQKQKVETEISDQEVNKRIREINVLMQNYHLNEAKNSLYDLVLAYISQQVIPAFRSGNVRSLPELNEFNRLDKALLNRI